MRRRLESLWEETGAVSGGNQTTIRGLADLFQNSSQPLIYVYDYTGSHTERQLGILHVIFECNDNLM